MCILDWLRVILTSRSYGEEVSRELDDFNPRIIHLYGEQHMNDIQVIIIIIITLFELCNCTFNYKPL